MSPNPESNPQPQEEGRGALRPLSVFNQVSLDGYFVDGQGDMSWAHKAPDDQEWNEFVAGNASGGGVLVFGRITYQMMASFWPTEMALQVNPVVARQMSALQKVVFSRTLDRVEWENTTLVKGDLPGTIRRMKGEEGPDMVILGSGTLVAQLAQEGLIDEYQLVVNPIVLGSGRTLFEGQPQKLPLRLTKSRAFGNGNVLLCYQKAE
jgi:dihydrofolate reductase